MELKSGIIQNMPIKKKSRSIVGFNKKYNIIFCFSPGPEEKGKNL